MDVKVCQRCGKPIEGRRSNAKFCVDCAKGVRQGYAKKLTGSAGALAQRNSTNYMKELQARDTLMEPIIEKRQSSLLTDKEYIYRICPTCNGVLNKADRFCRFCGQRVRRDFWKNEEV